MTIPKYSLAKRKFTELAQEGSPKIQNLASEYFNDGVTSTKIQDFMVEASKDPEWLAQFNDALKIQKEAEFKKYTTEDLKAQFSIVSPELSSEEVDGRIKAIFATTGSDVTGGNVAIDPILPTNILDVDAYLFNNDESILNDITIIKEDGETQMPEFDIFPTADRSAEAAVTALKDFARRDGTDYKLNPNIKVQSITAINELALRKGSPTYFATLKMAMIGEIKNELVKQIFQGTNGSTQFHGILQSFIPATIANKRGPIDVTADANIAAEANKFRKLVLMLGTLPSNVDVGDLKMSDYEWVMTRNTWYQSIVPSMDGMQRYYLDAIMNGVPLLVGPGGLRVRLVSKNALADGTVVFGPMNKYYLSMPRGIEVRDDGGIVNFNAGQTLLKAFVFADGGYVRNFTRTSGYVTGVDDNRDRNAWRVATGF